MNEALTQLQHVETVIRELRINPWVVAVVAAILAAWMEQRRAARHAPPFTADHTGAKSGGQPR